MTTDDPRRRRPNKRSASIAELACCGRARFCSGVRRGRVAGTGGASRPRRSLPPAASVFTGILVAGAARTLLVVTGLATTETRSARKPHAPGRRAETIPAAPTGASADRTSRGGRQVSRRSSRRRPKLRRTTWKRGSGWHGGDTVRLSSTPRTSPGAKEAIDRVLSTGPDNVEALRTRGNLAYDRRDYPDAERYLASLPRTRSIRPGCEDRPRLVAPFPRRSRKSQKRSIERSSRNEPNFVQAHLNLGIALHADGDADAANASLRKKRSHAASRRSKRSRSSESSHLAAKLAKAPAAPRPHRQTRLQRRVSTRSGSRRSARHPIVGPKIDGDRLGRRNPSAVST